MKPEPTTGTERLEHTRVEPGHRVKSFRVEVREGPDEGAAPVSSGGAKVTVGSGVGNTLRLAHDRKASRFHLELTPGVRSVIVRDLGSTNGTRIDAARFRDAAVELFESADLQVGETWVRVDIDAEMAVVPTLEAPTFAAMVGRSPVMRAVFERTRQVAPTKIPVLITGENGTGKELLARAIHAHATGRGGRFVVVDCSAVPETLAESEFFGTERGGFTNAARRAGPFERAHRGTLFLDEIGELPLSLQPKLLRVLEEGTVQRVGGSQRHKVDVRVVCATNRDLRRRLNDNTFRTDLFFRLAGCEIEVPPLRERLDDLDDLIEAILRDVCRDDDLAPDTRLGPEQVEAMRRREWPGNIRELRHHVRLLAHGISPTVHRAADAVATATLAGANLEDVWMLPKAQADAHFEKEYLLRLFARCEHSVTAAATAAGLNRVSLNRALQRHKIKR